MEKALLELDKFVKARYKENKIKYDDYKIIDDFQDDFFADLDDFVALGKDYAVGYKMVAHYDRCVDDCVHGKISIKISRGYYNTKKPICHRLLVNNYKIYNLSQNFNKLQFLVETAFEKEIILFLSKKFNLLK
jgi:hypothetical protein